MPNLRDVAARRTMHDANSLDFYVITELRVAMARVELERTIAGDADPRFTVAELADLVPGLNAEQLGRRFRMETGVTLNDLEQLSEALGVEPWALLKAALIRKRQALGMSNTGRLRDQVTEGPAGLPTIQ